eukprot:TRINITY_DN546_c0_g1_i1.p1 TRINITY_DN546_c0_g1~~TRINITY_DN546_c0_g1_i1.p1  ORF type:complete len:374 (+),score=125.08 TRINITY_DN546_c0_g1_i1:50-1171(+)
MKMLALLGLIAVCVADETVKGVTFTDAQAQATLDAANKATFYTLHYTFDIYDYKTNNIIAGRHYPSLTKLSQVSGVTKFVLNLFKTQVSKVCPPLPSDMSGNYKGVSFTNTQAVAAVKAANLASYESLTKVADIYDYKVEAIFRARPVCDMTALAAVDGMTHTPLKLLKGFYSPDDCYTNDDCATGTRCFGIPHDKILSTGKCRPTARIPGEGAQCSSSSPCQSGLYCAGLLGHPEGTEGNCVPEWMVGTFVPPKGKLTVAVPSDAVTTNEGFVPVWGLASVPVDVVLSLKTDGNLDYSSIKIVGVDPNGATATFWDGPNETGPFPEFRTLGGMISRDDSVNGAWKILVSNPGGAAQNGRVFTFSFFLSSRWD